MAITVPRPKLYVDGERLYLPAIVERLAHHLSSHLKNMLSGGRK